MFARLQSHAEPLVDTIETVTSRALDALEKVSDGTPKSQIGPREFNPFEPPSLAHTVLNSVELAGVSFMKRELYWNILMYQCVLAAAKRGLSPADISRLMVVPFIIGQKSDNGYRFLPEAGISVQGQYSNGAWQQAAHICKDIGCHLKVVFTCSNNEKAAMPNVTGSFTIELGQQTSKL